MNVKDVVKNANKIEKQIKELTAELSECKIKIQQFFDKKGIKNITVESEDHSNPNLMATKIERVYIDYDMDKLKEKIDKKVFDKIAMKEYTIVDMESMINLLRESGIKPIDFKRFIKVVVKPNKDMMKNLYELGELNKKHLEGCYTAKIIKSVQIK